MPEEVFRFALVAHAWEIVDCVRRAAPDQDVDLQYRVATSEMIIPVARKFLEQGQEVILCHGGTGNSLVRAIGHSVVAIDRTDMDVIKVLRRARTISKDIAIATFLEEFHDIEEIENLLDIRLHTISYASWEEQSARIREVYDRGVRVLVGGGVSSRRMRELGGTGFVIEPNVKSIRNALEQAKAIARQKRVEARRKEELLTIFGQLQDGVVCVDSGGGLIFANETAARLLKVPAKDDPALWRPLYEKLLLTEVLADLEPRRDVVASIRNSRFVVTAAPLLLHANLSGAVAVFRAVSAYQHIHRKIGEALYSRGFVARHSLESIRGDSPAVRRFRHRIMSFAATEATVHICGETGTGKELAAHALHAASSRRKQAFVAVNSAALPESLMESELFGYEEGAFTGARRGGKMGLFEMANNGTLFLDEVGELSPAVQLRLLRVLESREVMRVGGGRILPLNVRIISASHCSLMELARAGSFRMDLCFRLTTLQLTAPPLRERTEDIPALVGIVTRRYNRSEKLFSPAMFRLSAGYAWPGNVRELLALAERYCVLNPKETPDEVLFEGLLREQAAAMSGERAYPGRPCTLKEGLDRARVQLVREALARCGGDRREAARQLGISSTTLWRFSDARTAGPGERAF